MSKTLADACPRPTWFALADTAERPLTRLHHHGREALSVSELLTLLLDDAPDLAATLLEQFGSLHRLAQASPDRLRRVCDLSQRQVGRLLALLELSRRLQAPPADERPRISSPADAAQLLLPRLRHLTQEELQVMLLDTRRRVLGIRLIYKGTLCASVVRIGELFRPAIEAPASALLLAHNHPSGDPTPSPEDIRVTRQAVQAGELLGIEVVDHLIIGNGRYTSLREKGLGFDEGCSS